MQASKDRVEAWIDVGGTFTDCYVRRPGQPPLSGKTLSSGRIPLSFTRQRGPCEYFAPELAGDPPAFWTGASIVAFQADVNGAVTEGRRYAIDSSEDGWLTLAQSLPSQFSNAKYEVATDLEAPVLAVRRLLACPLQHALPALNVRIGTTRGTNAMLTRSGANVALAVTAPFGDILEIGDQTRPDLFALNIKKQEPLTQVVVEIEERLDSTGDVLQPLNVQQCRQALAAAREQGCDSLAVCLLHSYVNSEHERCVASIGREVGFDQISVSSQLAPLIEVVARAQTAVVDAYLGPIVRDYLDKLVTQFGGVATVNLQTMTSAGSLRAASKYAGKDSILSGPAGGVIALQAIGKSVSCPRVIGMDMGGTSTDVCRVDGQPELQFESTKAGIRILTPTLPIETVAAGGGSICWLDGVSLRVGPHSAGAFPGPACYGRGGPLTITDLNVYLHRVPEDQFPFKLDRVAIEKRLYDLLATASGALGRLTPHQLAIGFRSLANEQMAGAIRTVSIAQGADPREHVLVGFGGAAGQHVCEVAELLGIEQIVDTTEAGMLSALGMGLAPVSIDETLPVYRALHKVRWPDLRQELDRLTRRLAQQLHLQLHSTDSMQPISSEAFVAEHRLELRYAGTSSPLLIAWTNPAAIPTAFEEEHRKRFGYLQPQQDIELVSVRTRCSLSSTHQIASEQPVSTEDSIDAANRIASLGASSNSALDVIPRSALTPGQSVVGPAVIANRGSTLMIDVGWRAVTLSGGTLRLNRLSQSEHIPDAADNAAQSGRRAGTELTSVDPVFRDCYSQRLSAIATQMGLVLQQTAKSVNVRQRRDFSCAVFDRTGQLLANAPHVPVHLGAMGQTVRSILEEFPAMQPGDCFVTNDPYCGGSHLPDITVVTPVFTDDTAAVAFLVANRAHHADVGGIAPGSMPIGATTLGEEGVVISPQRLVAAGADQSTALRQLFQQATHPPRAVDEVLADLAAQQAANQRGVALLEEYAATAGWPRLVSYSEHLLAAADARTKQFLTDWFGCASGHCQQFADQMDDGTVIAVSMRYLGDGQVEFDFRGSGDVSPTNLNANPSIVTAAVLYVLRVLIADELPLNEGVLRGIRLIIPRGILNPPAAAILTDSPAVAAGNVETSQRVVDVLLGALGAAAASQGTMNNLLFGNDGFGFYETICGGSGATSTADGASAVHTHMTNTRLTDPEVLELHYPVRLVEFGVRAGSGGIGVYRGGDGVVRTLEFREQVDVSLITSRRDPHQPFGLCGGTAGLAGRNELITKDGSVRILPASCNLSAARGDTLRILTPGGGGYGKKDQR